jgi:DNA-binding CsgD family transcriptional regulator
MNRIPSNSDMTYHKKLSADAFILYKPQEKKTKKVVFYNEPFISIFSLSVAPSKKNELFGEILTFCSKWKELLDKRLEKIKEAGTKGTDSGIIDILKSYRRQYSVKGIMLSGHHLAGQEQAKQYLFILERVSSENASLLMAFRSLNLNNREKDIVKLLLSDRSNKEIADILGLSLSTVKGYMKILLRKLGVSSRAGIVSVFIPASMLPVDTHGQTRGKFLKDKLRSP